MNRSQLQKLTAKGEGPHVEFKQSTAELTGAMQALCAFLNAKGGTVVIGVSPKGKLVGQQVSDDTQQKIAAALERFEPPAPVRIEYVTLPNKQEVIVFHADSGGDSLPFTFECRPFERVGTTTRRMPQLRAYFPERKIEREDRLAIPPAALREILLNAVIHRDYSDPGGYVAIAVFDDRVEIRSIGKFPGGITAESLAAPHLSRLRNPLIAEAFHRTGAIEIWGRGTNRVIAECRRYGLREPDFREEGGAVVVTFWAEIGATAQVTMQVTMQVAMQVAMQVEAVLDAAQTPATRAQLQQAAKMANRDHFRKAYLRPLLEAGWLEMVIPDKPQSRLQRYRITSAGREALQKKKGGHKG